MATLRQIFEEWKEGDLFTPSETAEWHMLTPVKGDIAMIPLGSTDLEQPPPGTAAFLILERSVTSDGGMELAAKFIGGEDKEGSKMLSLWLNRRGGAIHLCSSFPCTHFDPRLLHATQVRFFTNENFTAEYYGAHQRRQVKKWLTGAEAEEIEVSGGEEAARGRAEAAELEKAVAREKGKGNTTPKSAQRPGALRKAAPKAEGAAPKARVSKTPGGKTPGSGDPKTVTGEKAASRELPEELRLDEGASLSVAGTAELKEKLEALRLRLGGASKPKRVHFAPESEADDGEDAEQEVPAASSSVQGSKSLSTGLTLKRATQRSEDTRDTSTKSISSQLALQAQQMAENPQGWKKTSKSPSTEKEKGKEDVLALLNRVLGETSSAGRGGDGGDPPEKGRKRSRGGSKKRSKKKKDKGKKKKRKLVNGVLVSTSSSEDSCSESSGDETDEFEAPLRRRAKSSPGSVLRLLVRKAQTALDQSSLVEVDPTVNSAITAGVKLVTYYQLHIRPHHSHARGQMRDMHLMAQTLDLIRSGQVALACDHLAGHFLATHQSLLDQGWGQARFLEVMEGEETNATSAAILLETRRHAKASMKAETPDAWFPGRNRSWLGGDGRGKGWWQPEKGKGKGKKGKWKEKDKGDRGKEGKGKNVWKDSQDKPDQSQK